MFRFLKNSEMKKKNQNEQKNEFSTKNESTLILNTFYFPLQCTVLQQQSIDVRVYDEFAIRGNTAVLRCQLPSYVSDYASIDSWIRNDGFIVKFGTITDMDSRYLVFPSGELHIKSVRQEDSDYSFRCQIMDHLTAKITLSTTAGRLIVTESEAIVPRFVHRMSSMKVAVHQVAMIPCVAESFPYATIKWYKQAKGSNSMSTIRFVSQRLEQHSDGTLIISDANVADSGSYLCVVNNNIGEQKSLTEFNVVGECNYSIHTHT
ncbi:hypothetical protein B4U80_01889 [Leptotrombidium deliense]|uniref:Ig-like domain-containing protein n=1 Tax=Leptotrombidium deliense TaxID=299467 RepID=A0A443SRM3_9ACAR|nr:hypothetical protein B4U80_01889 [Leptotrombidium deliense]